MEGTNSMKLDQRGFVLSGLALLLVLPTMLVVASCFKAVETGGEATAIQITADKVIYAGKDIERVIKYMLSNDLTIDNTTLQKLADNYQVNTGLLVTIWRVDNNVIENVRDPRTAVIYFENIALL